MIVKICAFAILSVILAYALDSLGFKSKALFVTLCALMILSLAGESLSRLFGFTSTLAEKVGISEATECALKAVGLGHIFGFTSDFCASLGESGIAKAVTVVGRVEIFLVAYPYFEKIIALGIKLLE